MQQDAHSADAIAQAAQVLARGELLGLPTETVYGLAADADQEAAVRQIFVTKGRPADHPLIVHVASADDVSEFAREVPEFAQRLMAAHWPGPLTLILPRRADRAAVAAGGQDSVGLRCPSHPVAQAVLRAAQTWGVRGVAAPSANRFGRVSPTTAAHVREEFADLYVIDGGACEVGIESTIVDCTRGVPVLLRPGVLTPEQLTQACGVSVIDPRAAPQARAADQALNAPAPRASGTLESHYAPHARLRLMSATDLARELHAFIQQTRGVPNPHSNAPQPTFTLAVWARQSAIPLGVSTISPMPAHVYWQTMPHDARTCAHELFAVLRAMDALGVAEIWVESPPAGAQWDGVRDRLSRASVR